METQLTENFFDRTQPEPITGCWLWTGSPDKAGYGHLAIGNSRTEITNYYAHRLAYILFKGPIPEGTELDHLCRVRTCVNPDHLEAVAHRVNVLRGESPLAAKARQTHCKHGHQRWFVRSTGRRECMECNRLRAVANRAKQWQSQ